MTQRNDIHTEERTQTGSERAKRNHAQRILYRSFVRGYVISFSVNNDWFRMRIIERK